MPLIERIVDFHADMKAWRHDIHTHPELAFQEHRTSDLVAKALERFGIEVHRGLAGTGVVGTLRSGRGRGAIGLRADMDALPIRGIMHACGHDGHTAMLLGAARYLAETRQFDGVVHFIFQPAEENECGGQNGEHLDHSEVGEIQESSSHEAPAARLGTRPRRGHNVSGHDLQRKGLQSNSENNSSGDLKRGRRGFHSASSDRVF